MTTTDSRGLEIVQHWLQHCAAPVRVDDADAERLAQRIDTVLTTEQFRTLILKARLDGWEAACTAQIQAIEALLPFARALGAATVIAQAEAAISTNVGRTLLERLNRLEGAIARALDACPCCRAGTCTAPVHQWLRDARDTEAPHDS